MKANAIYFFVDIKMNVVLQISVTSVCGKNILLNFLEYSLTLIEVFRITYKIFVNLPLERSMMARITTYFSVSKRRIILKTFFES